jgi:flagellar biosynthetic protein FlhB
MADNGQRTEKPTPRRLERARKEGKFPVSREAVASVQFLLFALLLGTFGARWYHGTLEDCRYLLRHAFSSELTQAEVVRFARGIVARDFAPLALFGGALLAVTLAAQLATTRFGIAGPALAPNFGRLNFFARFKQLPRQNLPLFAQAAVLLPLFAFAVYGILKDNFGALLLMPLQGVDQSARQMAASIQSLVWKAAAVFLVLGAYDYWRQHRRYMADLRMSKQELREEAKEMEGDPQIKSRIRQLRREWLRRRMMQQVPKATAVIVNPTHYAVAIRYAMDSMAVPKVVAKGKNYLALRIRQKAIEHQVPIVENPPLAQALYKSVEVGQEIPAHLYRAVAEILAYIYRLMGGRLPS